MKVTDQKFYNNTKRINEYVCEENVILVQIYYEEDTHHLQAYFLYIVNEVKLFY